MRHLPKAEQLAPHVYCFNSGRPGPTVGIAGGIHGNEPTGVLVCAELVRLIEGGEIELASGCLIIITQGNPLGVEHNMRGSVPGADLNRYFRRDLLEGSGSSYEEHRARELAPILARADFLLDIHSTQKSSVPFLTWGGVNATNRHRRLARLFGAGKILLDPELILTGPGGGCTDDFVHRMGGTALCYETGQCGDTSQTKQVLGEAMNWLRYLGVVAGEPYLPPSDSEGPEWYELVKAIHYPEGVRLFERQEVYNFQPLSELTGASRDDHFLIFPKPERDWLSGKPMGFLAKKLHNQPIVHLFPDQVGPSVWEELTAGLEKTNREKNIGFLHARLNPAKMRAAYEAGLALVLMTSSGEPIGFMAAWDEGQRTKQGGRYLELGSVWVREDFQGKGWGKFLYESYPSLPGLKAVDTVFGITTKDGAVHLGERIGFTLARPTLVAWNELVPEPLTCGLCDLPGIPPSAERANCPHRHLGQNGCRLRTTTGAVLIQLRKHR